MSQSVSDQDASVLGKRVYDGSPQKPEDDVTPGPAEEDDDDDDDVGPMPLPAEASSNGGARKKRKGLPVDANSCGVTDIDGLVLPHEKLYLEHLPAADRYFKSFMHRDAITFNVITKSVFRYTLIPPCLREDGRTNYLVTTSIDGHVKLWKKQEQGIEFVKHYRAHLSTIVGISASSDGQLFASVAEDGTAKVFDILNYGQHRLHHHLLTALKEYVLQT